MVNGSLTYTTSPVIPAVEIFTFTSIISAVDPVAVLAIFSEVNEPSVPSPPPVGWSEPRSLLHGVRRVAAQ